jgi:hypothetical protein
MKGIVSLSLEYTDEERLQLRKAGTTGPREIDGKVYMTFGQTTAGTPMMVTRDLDVVMHGLRDLREKGCQRLADAAQAAGLDPSGEWEAANFDGLCGVRCKELFLLVANLGREVG